MSKLSDIRLKIIQDCKEEYLKGSTLKQLGIKYKVHNATISRWVNDRFLPRLSNTDIS